jgi:hypothetical protein
VAAALTAVGIGALGAPGAAQARTSFCSPSGDYCTSTFRENGRRFAGLRTAALYGPGPRYTLCLRGPDGAERCRRFTLRRGAAGVYASTVTLSAHFSLRARGTYRVRFRHGDVTYGPVLTFRR